MIRWTMVLLLCAGWTWSGCNLQPEAVGSNHEIVVVVAPDTWSRLETAVQAIFDRTIVTPQEERIFTLRVVPPEDFDFYRKFKNVLVLAPLDAQDTGGELVNSLVSGEVRAQILSGQAYQFLKRDVWGRGQSLIVLSGSDEASLLGHLQQHGEEIYDVQESVLNEKVKAWLYEGGRQEKLAEKFSLSYGWTLQVPVDHDLAQERPGDRFVFLRKTVPDRWLFVYWEAAEGPQSLTEAWCLSTRERLGSAFYDGDALVEGSTRAEAVRFVDREALMIEGLWQNDTAQAGYAAGGPFRSYCFYDAAARRLYMLDIAVFAPGMSKEPYLRQLDIIAHTFQTTNHSGRL